MATQINHHPIKSAPIEVHQHFLSLLPSIDIFLNSHFSDYCLSSLLSFFILLFKFYFLYELWTHSPNILVFRENYTNLLEDSQDNTPPLPSVSRNDTLPLEVRINSTNKFMPSQTVTFLMEYSN